MDLSNMHTQIHSKFIRPSPKPYPVSLDTASHYPPFPSYYSIEREFQPSGKTYLSDSTPLSTPKKESPPESDATTTPTCNCTTCQKWCFYCTLLTLVILILSLILLFLLKRSSF